MVVISSAVAVELILVVESGVLTVVEVEVEVVVVESLFPEVDISGGINQSGYLKR